MGIVIIPQYSLFGFRKQANLRCLYTLKPISASTALSFLMNGFRKKCIPCLAFLHFFSQ